MLQCRLLYRQMVHCRVKERSMKTYIILILCVVLPGWLSARVTYTPAPPGKDTLELSLNEIEAIFLEHNLLLLAGKYEVSAAAAAEIQARLYNNPSVSAELALYGDNRKWLDLGGRGQKSFAIDQLIELAGKRKKRTLLAQEQTRQAHLELFELMRTLKYELRQSFYTVVYANELIEQFDIQLRFLQSIIDAYDEQSRKNNVPLKDAVRLKTEYVQLSADRNAVVMDAIGAQQTLQLLLATHATVKPVKTPFPIERNELGLATLLERAEQHRPDLLRQESLLTAGQLDLKYQQSLAIPDLSFGFGYDQSGSYVNNFYSIRTAISLPIFNRNQGNIRIAEWKTKAAEQSVNYKRDLIYSEITTCYQRAMEAQREYNVSQQIFDKDFPGINRSVIENFNRGNISMLEFTDFFENYNSAIRQVNQLQKQRRLAWEELEFAVGAPL